MSLKTFAAEVLTDFPTVAAIAPSSSHLAGAMLEPLPLARARTVLELGAGTGVITRALLDALPRHAMLFAFEINHRFFVHLKKSIADPRLVLFNSSAENLGQALRRRGIKRVDAVVSSLGLGFMDDLERHRLLGALVPFLDARSVLTQFQYIHGLQLKNGRLRRLSLRPLLSKYFQSVQSKTIWRNLPPAFVFTCRACGRVDRDSSR